MRMCIVSVIAYDRHVGQIIVTRDHHVYVNEQPVEVNAVVPVGLNFSVVASLKACGIQLFGVKGYTVCYNGDTENVTVWIDTASFKGQTCGLCGPSRDLASPIQYPTRTSVVGDRSTFFKLIPWKCDVCHYTSLATRQAQLACDKGINSPIFKKCRDRLKDRDRLMMLNQCMDRVCRCPKSYQKQCICNAVAEFSIVCAKMGIIVDWRNEQYCSKLRVASVYDVSMYRVT